MQVANKCICMYALMCKRAARTPLTPHTLRTVEWFHVLPVREQMEEHRIKGRRHKKQEQALKTKPNTKQAGKFSVACHGRYLSNSKIEKQESKTHRFPSSQLSDSLTSVCFAFSKTIIKARITTKKAMVYTSHCQMICLYVI